MNALQDLIAKAANAEYGVTFITVQDGSDGEKVESTEKITWSEMLGRAVQLGSALDDVLRSSGKPGGLGPGAVIGVIGSTSVDPVVAIESVWLHGAAVSVLPLPFRFNDMDEFIDATRQRIADVGIDIMLLDDIASLFLADVDLGVPSFVLSSLSGAQKLSEPRADVTVGLEDLAIVQFTSGATSEPKPVAVTYRVLVENLTAISDHLGLWGRSHSAVSWLPLYHDMGLVGVLANAMITGSDLVLAAPQDFIARPHRWMEWIAEHRATLTAGPNFAYSLAAKALADPTRPPIDLSCLSVAMNGAEPIWADEVGEFVAAGTVHGLDPGVPMTVFGMAEVGIAVSLPPAGSGLRVEMVDVSSLTRERVAAVVDEEHDGPVKEMVKLGTPLRCVDVSVVDPDSRDVLPARRVGEIVVSGPSVVDNYLSQPVTDASFSDGRLHTGDLGYLTDDGDVVFVGRISDLVHVGDRFVLPQDVEVAVSRVDGVRSGNVAVFGIDGDSDGHIYVVAESKLVLSMAGDPGLAEALDRLMAEIAVVVSDVTGSDDVWVSIARPGLVPKTSSGKLRRGACREMMLAGAFECPQTAG